MLKVTLETDDAVAMEMIKAHARELNIVVLEEENNEEDPDEFYYLKGVKVRKAKGELNIKELSGSFPDLGLDPETYRKDLWTRNKD
jgi:ribosomal 30S subunit maturation factor RimM